MAEQVERLSGYRGARDENKVKSALDALHAVAADESAPLMPTIVDAVRAEATLGEICGTMRDVFGDYHPPATV
jgi:methylmalonyl-CoA mutase N-terminal domain/subunit